MRHQKKGFKLGRTNTHRKATLAALSTALIQHKRITTTLTKAKALRMYVEPLINRAKVDTSHNRRQVFRYLQSKQAVTELFGEIAEQVGDRSGGYTRVIRLGQRGGDAAEMAMIELVDYNDVKPEGAATKRRRRTRRGRRRRGGEERTVQAAPVVEAAAAVEAVEEAAGETVVEAEAAAVETVTEAEATVEVAETAVAEVAEAATDAVEETAEVAEEAAAEAIAEADVTPEEGEQAAGDDEADEKKA